MKAVIVSVLALLLNGVVLMKLWGWFIAPTFGIADITFTQAIGISLVAELLGSQHIPRNEEQLRELCIYVFVSPIILIIFGWCVHLFL